MTCMARGVSEIVQDIVGVEVVTVNGAGLVLMTAVLAKYVPYRNFYHVAGAVVVYACLAAAAAVPFWYIVGVSGTQLLIRQLIM